MAHEIKLSEVWNRGSQNTYKSRCVRREKLVKLNGVRRRCEMLVTMKVLPAPDNAFLKSQDLGEPRPRRYQAAVARHVVVSLNLSRACCASTLSMRGSVAASIDACRVRAILRASRVSASIRAVASVMRKASGEPRRLSDLPYLQRIAASRCRRSTSQAFRV